MGFTEITLLPFASAYTALFNERLVGIAPSPSLPAFRRLKAIQPIGKPAAKSSSKIMRKIIPPLIPPLVPPSSPIAGIAPLPEVVVVVAVFSALRWGGPAVMTGAVESDALPGTLPPSLELVLVMLVVLEVVLVLVLIAARVVDVEAKLLVVLAAVLVLVLIATRVVDVAEVGTAAVSQLGTCTPGTVQITKLKATPAIAASSNGGTAY